MWWEGWVQIGGMRSDGYTERNELTLQWAGACCYGNKGWTVVSVFAVTMNWVPRLQPSTIYQLSDNLNSSPCSPASFGPTYGESTEQESTTLKSQNDAQISHTFWNFEEPTLAKDFNLIPKYMAKYGKKVMQSVYSSSQPDLHIGLGCTTMLMTAYLAQQQKQKLVSIQNMSVCVCNIVNMFWLIRTSFCFCCCCTLWNNLISDSCGNVTTQSISEWLAKTVNGRAAKYCDVTISSTACHYVHHTHCPVLPFAMTSIHLPFTFKFGQLICNRQHYFTYVL